jgi:hypothetical protein
MGTPMPELIYVSAPPQPAFAVRRSPGWADARREHLTREPACVVTGIDDARRVAVHHIMPFHLFPELELDPGNLITLAESPINIHFLFGHGGRSWCDYNRSVRRRVARMRELYELIARGVVRGGIS